MVDVEVELSNNDTAAFGSAASNTMLDDSRPPALSIHGLHKVYGNGVQALRGPDLVVAPGEFVTLLGPSGSGKTTLLMVVAGFEQPTRGRVYAGGSEITHVAPEKRNFGVVFQNYALFPHMTVRGNVAYPLVARRIRGKKRRALIEEALALVDLEGLDNRRPMQLSGGQQQRVALARALVYRPSVLLLDEPLGALDRALRERMQVELRRLHQQVRLTFLYVTHDQEEALTMSDRVVVLRDGSIEQVGTPEEVYAHPATEFVAAFVGAANMVPASVIHARDGVARVRLESGLSVEARCAPNLSRTSDALMVVRPERLMVHPTPDDGSRSVPALPGRLEREVFGGSTWRYSIRTEAGELQVHMTERVSARVGDPVGVSWDPMDAWALRRDLKGGGKRGGSADRAHPK